MNKTGDSETILSEVIGKYDNGWGSIGRLKHVHGRVRVLPWVLPTTILKGHRMGIIGSHLGPIITRNPVAKMIRFKSASMLAERPNRPDDGSLRSCSWSSREQLVTALP